MLLTQNITAQPKLHRNEVPYKIKVYDKENIIHKDGILYSVTDSSVVLISELDYNRFRSNISIEKEIVIPANQINKIILWKKGRFVKVLGISTLIGGTIGTIMGYSGGDDSTGLITLTSKEKALLGSIGGAVIGTITGCFIGTSKIRIIINSDSEKFNKKKDFLAERSALRRKNE